MTFAKNADPGISVPARPVRVVLADDDDAILGQVERMLGPAFEIVARAPDGASLVESALETHPDLIITDISMPGMNGIRATRAILESSNPKVIVLSVHHDRAYVDAAFDAGATGFVWKLSAVTELEPAVEAVLHGRPYVSPAVV